MAINSATFLNQKLQCVMLFLHNNEYSSGLQFKTQHKKMCFSVLEKINVFRSGRGVVVAPPSYWVRAFYRNYSSVVAFINQCKKRDSFSFTEGGRE